MAAACTAQDFLSSPLRFIIARSFFCSVPLILIFSVFLLISAFFFLLKPAVGDEFQPVTVRYRTDVATDAGVRNDKDDGGKLAVNARYQNWKVD